MPSLRDLAAARAPLLIVDAASARIQVGLWTAHGPGNWATTDAEAGTGIFECCARLGVKPDQPGAFVFCEGPGSILGVRTAAMAIRTWTVLAPRPVYAYASLTLVAQSLPRPDMAVIADARRDSWHHAMRTGVVRRVPTAGLTGDLVMPEHFRHWSALPAAVGRVPYDVPTLLMTATDADILRQTENPDAFLHEEPSYVTWTPQVHRAP